ncbi:MAG: M28 family peptidase, partial [bacterium]|nr:M28 family peptidase [bacterium]
LSSSGVEAVARLSDGFLVLADPAEIESLAESGLDPEFVAPDVSRQQLAVDNRLDRTNTSRYPLLFEQENFRLYNVDWNVIGRSAQPHDLAQISSFEISFDYQEESPLNWSAINQQTDLTTLIELVNTDSLISYTERLQAFGERVTGTDSNYASIDWTIAKFQEIGYDSVYTQDFNTTIYSQSKLLRNVIATKIGTLFPNRYIIVCGHRDGVPTSPAANDNGSGTAGTLEMARVLLSEETYCSILFILFDGEEQGLHGSYEYADLAASRDDSIIYVLNMDMIAHYENEFDTKLYHGTSTTYSELWQSLADSLVGLNGILSGTSSGSDHYPFQQYGYEVTFVHENIFSSVYHSPQDSTTYMDFNYMTKVVKASLATIYSVMIDATAPRLEFAFPDGLPEYLTPLQENLHTVQINPLNLGSVVNGTAMQHTYINGTPQTPQPMTETGPDQYELVLPSVDCEQQVSFSLSAVEESGTAFFYPDQGNSIQLKVATSVTIDFEDDFETDAGWTREISATSGMWTRGVPVDDPAWAYDPASDGDGSGQCYLTQNGLGNTDVDGGFVRLNAPLFELPPSGSIEYFYYLNLTNTSGGVDRLLVEISANDLTGPWTEIARHDTNGGLLWRHHAITADEVTAAGGTLSSSMRVRFTANDSDPQSIVEAGVDGFRVDHYECATTTCGDMNGDNTIDITDLTYLVDFMFAGGPPPTDPIAADVDGSGAQDIADLTYMVDFLFAGGPAPIC